MYQSAPEQIRKALRPYGYYHATVQGELREISPEQFLASFEVDRGEPVIVKDARATVEGAGGDMPAVQAALRQFAPRKGERFQASVYEANKERVNALLRSAGSFIDARFDAANADHHQGSARA